jgi:protease-4
MIMPFASERRFTAAHREQMESLIDDLYSHFVKSIALARHLPEEQVFDLMKRGPFTPEEAKRVGLIDNISFEHTLVDEVKAKAEGGDFFSKTYIYQSHLSYHLSSSSAF